MKKKMKKQQNQVTLFQEALALHQENLLEEAKKKYLAFLAQEPQHADACANLAFLYKMQEKWEEAAEWHQKALTLLPKDVPLWTSLAQVFNRLENKTAAYNCWEQVAVLEPTHKEAFFRCGAYLLDEGQQPESAELFLRQAAKNHPEFGPAWMWLGRVLRAQMGRLGEAVDYLRQGVSLEPEDASAHCFLADGLLIKGSWDDGWREYEWRKKRPDAEPLFAKFKGRPEWDGRYFSKQHVLVYWEQGLGDTLQFCRYIQQVKARGGLVTFLVQPALKSLMESSANADWVVDSVEDASAYDYVIPLLSLPGIFGVSSRTVVRREGYLKVDESKQNVWRKRAASVREVPKIGLIWSGNTYQGAIRNRSALWGDLKPLLDVDGVQYVSLQKDCSAEERQYLQAAGVVEWGSLLTDFADTAAAMEQLDLVISVDTAGAHAGGGLGQETWLALPQRSEWRWLTERLDTPWYESMRLFRQTAEGQWGPVFQAMAEELRAKRWERS